MDTAKFGAGLLEKIRPRGHLTMRQREGLVGFLFLLPWVLGFLLLKAVPILAALHMLRRRYSRPWPYSKRLATTP